jgi:hypothetical protein
LPANTTISQPTLQSLTATGTSFFADNVGIGTSSPACKLFVNSGQDNALIAVFRGLSGGTRDLEISSFESSGSPNAGYNFNANSINGALSFSTNNTERMRIGSSGTISIGTTNTTSVANTETAAQFFVAAIPLETSRNSTVDVGHITFNNPNGRVGQIRTSGSSTSYNTSSDYRLKEDWQPMSGAITRLNQLKPVNFAWKVDGSRVDGFLAHEAQEVVPESVTGTKDAMRTEEYEVTPAVLDDEGNVVEEAVMGTREVPDYQGIDQAKLVPLLTAALQEAVAEINSLKARVEALEGAQ